MRDVEGVQVEILECSKCEDNPDGGKVNSRSEDFKVIESRTLVVALGHQSSLVAIYRAICIALHLKYPLGTDDLTPRRSRNKGPSTIGLVSS